MIYLYVDNFRGFRDTLIPILDVNFLVGENSTGKTSILSLLDLLGQPQFWLAQNFNAGESQLGHFNDIVSASSQDREYFKVGVIECAEPEKEDETHGKAKAFLLTFAEEEGLPIIHQYNRLYERDEIKIVFNAETIRYKSSKASSSCEHLAGILERFGEWINEDESREDFQVLQAKKIPFMFSRRRALVAIDMLAGILSEEEINDSETYKFSMRIPTFARRLTWIAPIRSVPKRTYDSYEIDFDPSGEHTPYLIKKFLSPGASTAAFEEFITLFGKESNLFESIDIKSFGEQLTDPFELRAVLNETPLRVSEVGYGVSQVLPIVVEVFARSKGYWFAIQQPEIHLHPKAQAAIGDVIFKLATEANKRFLIETHSDYIVDRFRLNYKNRQDPPDIASQVLFFERNPDGNKVTPIEILENGEYSPSQPEAFREFFILEELKLLGL